VRTSARTAAVGRTSSRAVATRSSRPTHASGISAVESTTT
jgi:hypothetical protein